MYVHVGHSANQANHVTALHVCMCIISLCRSMLLGKLCIVMLNSNMNVLGLSETHEAIHLHYMYE